MFSKRNIVVMSSVIIETQSYPIYIIGIIIITLFVSNGMIEKLKLLIQLMKKV
jgi:hypothetical protein